MAWRVMPAVVGPVSAGSLAATVSPNTFFAKSTATVVACMRRLPPIW